MKRKMSLMRAKDAMEVLYCSECYIYYLIIDKGLVPYKANGERITNYSLDLDNAYFNAEEIAYHKTINNKTISVR